MNRHLIWIATLGALAASACQRPVETPTHASTDSVVVNPADPHSFANFDAVPFQHLNLDLDVDFATRRLTGRATWNLGEHQANRVILDTNSLDVIEVALDDAEPTSWYLAPQVDLLGRALVIEVKPSTRRLTVAYATSPGADALQWLAPAQTAGGVHPFLFSQSQAILARTWVPCPDSPSVRFTWEATVRAPAALEVLMSAERTAASEPSEESRTFRFRMAQPIPSYLLAVAVGELERRELGPRTAVWAEPATAAAAAAEFVDTEAMITAVEERYGPYRWGRYDLLVLPPSFPFGGMENPLLTFVTPTLLAGDRSLVSLIAHELAHSWSGNLVTNANWNDFWLNEGFTTYLERRIMEAISGREYADMLASLALEDLEGTVAELGADSPDTRLRLELAGRNPDDGMSDIAYEKGAFFLRRLEEAVGRERFDPFLQAWFDQRAFLPTTTDDFLTFLDANLPGAREQVDVLAWIDGPGLPGDLPRPESARLAAAEAAAAAFVEGADPQRLATDGWSAHEWLRFLRVLPKPLSANQLGQLDRAFALTKSGNAEIQTVWFTHTIATGYTPANEALEAFLQRVGRRKLIKPLYEALVAGPGGREQALAIYTKARPGYHSVSTGTIDGIVGWSGG
jgi:aminopeptidase N